MVAAAQHDIQHTCGKDDAWFKTLQLRSELHGLDMELQEELEVRASAAGAAGAAGAAVRVRVTRTMDDGDGSVLYFGFLVHPVSMHTSLPPPQEHTLHQLYSLRASLPCQPLSTISPDESLHCCFGDGARADTARRLGAGVLTAIISFSLLSSGVSHVPGVCVRVRKDSPGG